MVGIERCPTLSLESTKEPPCATPEARSATHAAKPRPTFGCLSRPLRQRQWQRGLSRVAGSYVAATSVLACCPVFFLSCSKKPTMSMLHTAQKFATAIQQVNYPMHKGQPNPMHGKFFVVGSIPETCWDPDKDNGPFSPKGGSRFFDTEAQAIEAARAGGATYIQGVDCRRVF